jgi:hypothetical protein
MHYQIIEPNGCHPKDGETYDNIIAVFRSLGSADYDAKVLAFDFSDLWYDGTLTARDVTDDVVREGYDGGYLERDCDAVIKLLGPPPLTRDEHLANLGDADWHSGSAAP